MHSGGCKKCGSSLALRGISRERRARQASLTRWRCVESAFPSKPRPAPPPTPIKAPNHCLGKALQVSRHVPTPSLEMLGYSGKVAAAEAAGAGGGTYSSVTSFGMPLGRARRPLLLHRTTVSTQVHCSGQRGLSRQLLSSLPARGGTQTG